MAPHGLQNVQHPLSQELEALLKTPAEPSYSDKDPGMTVLNNSPDKILETQVIGQKRLGKSWHKQNLGWTSEPERLLNPLMIGSRI